MVLMLSLFLLAVPQSQPENSAAAGASPSFKETAPDAMAIQASRKPHCCWIARPWSNPGNLPGHAEDSILYKRITGAIGPPMPEGAPKLPDADIAPIKRWIDAGAPDGKTTSAEPRRFISNDDVISAIEKDLTSAGTDTSRRFLRYFTLTNLYNAGEQTRAYRSALFKLMNSLSWDKDITLPPVSIENRRSFGSISGSTTGRIRQRRGKRSWHGYPYGVESSGSAYARSAMTFEDSVHSCRLVSRRRVHAAALSRHPRIAHERSRLEPCGRNTRRCLNIDRANLRESPGLRVVRAGFTESGVSNSNRVVERHRSPYGAYWKSTTFRQHRRTQHLSTSDGFRARRRRDHLQSSEWAAGVPAGE